MTDTPSRPLAAHAYLIGARIDTRGLESENAIAFAPLTLKVGSDGFVLLFRYGAVVFVNVGDAERQHFLEMLAPRVSDRLPNPEVERSDIVIDANNGDTVARNGEIVLRNNAPERLQVVAHVLGKNAVLSHYEGLMSAVIDRVEPLAENLRRKGQSRSAIRELLRELGSVLSTQHRMIGRVEIDEKPDVLWDHPELERLYARLDDEYELRERNHALVRKLATIQETIRTMLDLVQDTRSHRVEWYIVLLIVIEIVLSLVERAGHYFS